MNAAPLVRFSPMISPPMGNVNVSTVWFAVPYRLVNKKFQKFITGYYQDTTGSSQFLKRPNMMFDFGQRNNQNDVFVKLFDPDAYLRYSLLSYSGFKTASKDYTVTGRLECARILAFWYVYFEYFVDQNVGYRHNPVIKESNSRYKIRLEDGTVQDTSSILNWEQFNQVVLYESTIPFAVGGVLTIGDAIEHGLDIEVYKCNETVLALLFTLPSKCWPKDYFTSALPWAQKGNPVSVPVTFSDQSSFDVSGEARIGQADLPGTGGIISKHNIGTNGSGTNQPLVAFNSSGSSIGNAILKGTVNASGHLSSTEANFTINELRTAYALQTWLEKNARCGSRYVEQILSHFGVRTSDARLNRPEYLGGFKIPVHVSSTAQTATSSDAQGNLTPQGTLAGQGVAAGSGRTIKFFSEEHCIIMCLTYVQPKALYGQGLSRLLKRNEFYDFYFPEFSHLGEQEIKAGELFYTGNPDSDDATFGYQSRYSEYKFMNDELSGDFSHDSLKSWLFGVRQFNSQPKLSPEFLQVNTTVEKSLLSPFPAYGLSSEDSFDKLICQMDFDIRMLRPMPKYGVPYL